ncbi:MAG: ribonuclease H-like domain-containing protein, partial [Candidatus Hodarchaeota archaeon]
MSYSLENRRVVKYSRKKPKIISDTVDSKVIRILAFSDWRVQRIEDVFHIIDKIEPVDLIIYAGDDLGRFKTVNENYFSLLSRFSKSGYLVAVLGNDDSYSYSKGILKDEGIHDLYAQSLVYKDHAFIGLESSTKGPAVFRHSEKDFKTHLKFQSKQLKGKRLVIVSHAPPFKILDRGLRFATDDESTHFIGSTALKEFIENNRVELVVCGHCHSHGGLDETFKETRIVNVASHDNKGSHGNFCVMEILKNGTVTLEWHSTKQFLSFNSPRRIHGIGPVRNEKLEKYGIDSIEELTKVTDIQTLSEKTGFSERYLKKIQIQAKSILTDETYQIAPHAFSNKDRIFFDIETDVNCERIWMIGILIDGQFTQLYAETWDQEREILSAFLNLLKMHSNRILVSYSTKNFDYRVSLNAIKRHELDISLFESFPHQDFGTYLGRCFIFPIQSFALKKLGQFLNYPFKHPNIDGFYVALNYMNHVEKEE